MDKDPVKDSLSVPVPGKYFPKKSAKIARPVKNKRAKQNILEDCQKQFAAM